MVNEVYNPISAQGAAVTAAASPGVSNAAVKPATPAVAGRQTLADSGDTVPPEYPVTLLSTRPEGGLATADQRNQNTSAVRADIQQKLAQAADRVEEYVADLQRNLQFRIEKDAGGITVVTVIEAQTDEVIRQIPSEEFLSMARHLREHSGVLIDAEA